ncbi:DEKNAAC104922 [Brettanomyces naardenensis]|uniref:DEKNAAC104922 n=1 Tax=Brettanomyces naardenensis TaxID=13370 RepID=A0A448YRX6_BRENA|nr:DEKNAAC104922 [Brettanomyces naardenensis]
MGIVLIPKGEEPPSLEDPSEMGVFTARRTPGSFILPSMYARGISDGQKDSGTNDNINDEDHESPDESNKSHRKRSKQGCITCKLRKKRCDEQKPVCGDCQRLNRRCEYITDDMTPEQIAKLKHEMELIEVESKTRRRKKKVSSLGLNVESSGSRSHTPENELKRKGKHEGNRGKRAKKTAENDKVVFNPLSIDISSLASTNWLQGMGATTESIGCLASPTPEVTEEWANCNNNNSGTPLPVPHEFTSLSPLQPPRQLPTSSTIQQIQPLSLDEESAATSASIDQFAEIFSPGFPKALQEHLQETENKTEAPKPESIPSISQLQNLFEFSPWYQEDTDEQKGEKVKEKTSMVLANGHHFVRNNSIMGSVPTRSASVIYSNPSVVTSTTLASLTPMGKQLYEYYRDKLCFVASSTPKEENMYLHTFLPMAHADQSVLYGILAWSAFHMGGSKMEKQGNYYIQRAIQGFGKRPVLDEDTLDYYKDVATNVDDNDEDIVKEDVSPFHEECRAILSMLSRDDMINLRLAAFLILCGVEICRGDVSRWSKYLEYGARLINLKGGLKRFNDSKDEHFLATNYAYHDITAVAVSKLRPLHFDLKEYEQMWTASNELGFLDPLHNISSPIFNILAEINKLASTARRLYRRIRKARSLAPGTIDDSDDEEFMAYAAEELAGAACSSPRFSSSDAASSNKHSSIGLSPVISKQAREAEAMEAKEEAIWETKNEDDSLSECESSSFRDPLSCEFSIYEKYDQIMVQCQELEARLNSAMPKQHILLRLKPKDLELQLTVFECFQLTAKIHLRQAVLRMAPSSLEIQYLVNQLIKSLDVLLGSDVEAALCFPMFIAGMNLIYPRDRKEMNERYNAFIKRYRWKNVLRCQIVMKQLWKMNPLGYKFVDWYDVVERMGWELSFA